MSETRQDRTKITIDRKLDALFQFVPKSMTLNGDYALYFTKYIFLEPAEPELVFEISFAMSS